VREGFGEQDDDVVVSPEFSEVLEREVDGVAHRTASAQVAELVELSLSAGHAGTMRRRADLPLHRG